MSVDRALRRSMLYGLRTFPVPLAAVCAIGAVIAVGMCLAVTVQAELYGAQGLSLGDYVAHLLMGMRQPQPVTGGDFHAGVTEDSVWMDGSDPSPACTGCALLARVGLVCRGRCRMRR